MMFRNIDADGVEIDPPRVATVPVRAGVHEYISGGMHHLCLQFEMNNGHSITINLGRDRSDGDEYLPAVRVWTGSGESELENQGFDSFKQWCAIAMGDAAYPANPRIDPVPAERPIIRRIIT